MKWIINIMFKLIISAIILLVVVNLYTILSTYSQIYSISDIEEHSEEFDSYTILVLGAGVIENRYPSPILARRLDTTLKARQILQVSPIVVSGDHMDIYYDEVSVMKNYLIDGGIASQNIYVDHAGYSTFDSLYRLKEVIGEERVIIITQRYHLYRALMIANNLNMDAIGIPAPDNPEAHWKREVREWAARVKDFTVGRFTNHPTATELGYGFTIDGNGDRTNSKENLE